MLPRVKKMWDEYRHMNYLKLNGGVDPCAAIRARLAEAEAQRDGLKETLELVTSLWPSMEEIDDDRSGAWWSRPSAVYLLKRARKALAKLEETK